MHLKVLGIQVFRHVTADGQTSECIELTEGFYPADFTSC